MAGLTAGLIEGRQSWSSSRTIVPLAAGVVLLGAFVAIELRKREPILEIGRFKNPLFLASLSGALFTGLAVIGLMSFTPLLLQRGLGVSVIGSAGVLAAWSTTSMAVALATRRLLGRRSAAAALVIGFAVSAAGEFALAGLGVGSSWTRLLPGLVILGIGSGVVNASLGRLALESVPRERAGMGSGANNTSRYLGGAAGVALVVALVDRPRRNRRGRIARGLEHGGDRVRRAVPARGADRGRVPPRSAVAPIRPTAAALSFLHGIARPALGSPAALPEKRQARYRLCAATRDRLRTGTEWLTRPGVVSRDSRKERYEALSRLHPLGCRRRWPRAGLLSVPAAFGATPGAGKLGLDDPLCASSISLLAPTCSDSSTVTTSATTSRRSSSIGPPRVRQQHDLPGDPPEGPDRPADRLRRPDSTTWNFELRPTFWFGLTLCDTESAPEYTKRCKPDSDSNNLVGTNPKAANYIGKHPGNAFMELQFDPPGYVPQFEGFGCTATQYCAAMTIDSRTQDQNNGAPGTTGTENTSACNAYILGGREPINWA